MENWKGFHWFDECSMTLAFYLHCIGAYMKHGKFVFAAGKNF